MSVVFRSLACMAALLLVLATGGCTKGSDSNSANSGEAASSNEGSDDSDASSSGMDPCALLEGTEVEAALGKLAGPPYRAGGDGPEAGGSSCMYEATGGRTLKLGAAWDGAASIFKMLAMPAAMAQGAGLKGKLPLPDGVTFEGEWDEARTVGCCLLYAMIGDQMVDIDFASTHLDMKQAAALANAALKRLEKPLSVNGNTGVEAALARAQKRPKPVPVCSLLRPAEVESILGPQSTAPSGSETSCTYAFTRMGMDGKPRTYPLDLKVEWTGGYHTLREEAQMAGQIMSTLTGLEAKPNAKADGAAATAAAGPAGPWEDSATTIHFMAVKKDVLMRVDLRIATPEAAEKLVAKAMEKI
ncbi:MAG: hypothetical protein ABI885_08690 [Gammaproteobacteria bacterium]